MAGLGLGGYGSDDEDSRGSGAGRDSQAEDRPPMLLHTYTSAEDMEEEQGNGLTPTAGRGFNAAPDVQDSEGSPQQSSGAQQASGDAGQDGSLPARPPSRLPPQGPMGGIADVYLQDLPPELRYPPPGTISSGTVEGLRKFGARDNAGRTFIDRLRLHQTYSNPNLLQQLVGAYGLQEKGSTFAHDVFHPDALPKEDHLDKLLLQLEREQERRKAVRATAPPGQALIAFERGAGALGTLPASHSAQNLQQQQQAAAAALAASRAAAAAAAAGGAGGLLNTASLREQAARNAEALAVAARKRSKWDAPK